MRSPRSGLVAGALAFLSLLLPLRGTNAAPRSLLEICADEAEEQAILERLDGWMSTARIAWRPLSRCSEAPTQYVGRFVREGARISFELRNRTGGTLTQVVPWLDASDAPLGRTSEQGMLPRFSLLLESLLAEERLGLASVPEKEAAPLPPPPPSKRRTAPPRPKAPSPAETKSRDPDPPVEEAPPDPPPPEEAPPSPEPAEEEAALLPEPAAETNGEEKEGEAAAPEDELEAEDAPVAFEDFGRPPGAPLPWEVEATIGARFRSPLVFAPEVGLGASLGPAYLFGAVQLPGEWKLAGRSILVGGTSIGAGLQQAHDLGPLELRLKVGALVERVAVERGDLSSDRPRIYWDVGPSLGAELRATLLGAKMGLRLEGGWMPTSREVSLPEGVSSFLGMAWGRLGLHVGFGK